MSLQSHGRLNNTRLALGGLIISPSKAIQNEKLCNSTEPFARRYSTSLDKKINKLEQERYSACAPMTGLRHWHGKICRMSTAVYLKTTIHKLQKLTVFEEGTPNRTWKDLPHGQYN
ncbi:hypothetical protein LWI29_016124 [Acer saccharum]|uniref:Uncharacterized protein n=1 Tax=Acer saccharum TaxID=4024 RepID=A0AA39T2B2_ACESA|nr:hypothetical protein LWI29_016124 [Acer saccharum]